MIFRRYEQHLLAEIDFLKHQLAIEQAKVTRLELAVWSQQSPAGSAFVSLSTEPETVTGKVPAIPWPTRMGWRELQEFDRIESEKEKQRDYAIRGKETATEAGKSVA